MSDLLSIIMVVSGALFVAGVVPIAWERAPAWRAADEARFRVDLAYTLKRVDQVGRQPGIMRSPARWRAGRAASETRTGSPRGARTKHNDSLGV